MAQNITANSSSAITLTSNPVSISATVAVTGGSAAIYGLTSGAPWTVTNSGVVTNSGAGGHGITLASGSVVNSTGGAIRATNAGGSGDAVIIGTDSASGGSGTIDNSGTLTNNNSTDNSRFVAELDSNGTIINRAGGTISGNLSGVGIRNNAAVSGTGSVSNLGVISGGGDGGSGFGVAVIGGMVVNNGSGGSITNFGTGVDVFAYQQFGAATVTNAGSISDGNGVILQPGLASGSAVTNASGGVINATGGIGISGADTIVNYGSIGATGGDAIDLNAGGLLIAKPSSTVSGVVNGGGGTLEMGSGTETIGDVTNFATITFDSGATAKVAGSATGLNNVTVNGFVTGDTLEITGAETISSFTGGVLTLGGAANVTIDLGTVSGTPTISPSGGNSDLTLVPCFRAGTRILTDAGEVAVEDLRAGMRVVSREEHRAVPVIWVGRRRIDCARHPRPRDVWPVRIAAGAFGEALPHRPLYLSPDHAVFVDGALVPARHLVNGGSVAQIACDEVEYFHVEIADHGVLVADGLPAESYLDTGNRALFAEEAADAAAAAARTA